MHDEIHGSVSSPFSLDDSVSDSWLYKNDNNGKNRLDSLQICSNLNKPLEIFKRNYLINPCSVFLDITINSLYS